MYLINIWIVFCIATKMVISQSERCPPRDAQAAVQSGRKCRKSCAAAEDRCPSESICSCDYECGLSCIKPYRRCRPLPIVSHIASVRLYRKSNDSTPPLKDAIYDDIALYECLAGYTLRSTHAQHRCDGTGRWIGSPQCVEAEKCPERDENAASAVGKRCRKRCFPGRNDCRKNRICLCSRECGYSCVNLDNLCDAPLSIENMGSMQVLRKNLEGSYEPIIEPRYRFNDVAKYSCAPGFRIEDSSSMSFCHERKGWTKPPECRRACRNHNAKAVSEYGMTCGSPCATDENCPNNMQCLCDGSCGRTCVNPNVDCGVAPSSNHATIEYTDEGFYRLAHYSCNDGFYVIRGSTTRKCTGGGSWDGKALTCGRVSCGDPEAAIRDQFGEVVDWQPGPHYTGRTFRFQCAQGYNLLGPTERTCLSNGRWSGRHIACDRKDTIIRCRHPGVPVNGRILTRRPSFEVGSVVSFTCDSGYVLVGEAEQTCLYFLQWSGNGAPLCVDPKYTDSSSDVVEKLQTSTSLIQSRSNANAGRFISADFGPGHEIYFLFDLSRSVRDSELNNSLEFAIKLIERLSANATGAIEYGAMIFASDVGVILDIHDQQPTPNEVIRLLGRIGKDRENFQAEISYGTHTARAINTLRKQLAFSYVQNNKKSRKRHVFFLTDGRHNEGPPPEVLVERIVRLYSENPPEFYSITSCVECSEEGDAVEAYKELLGLANNKLQNFILIPNFYLVQEVLDLVTDARADFTSCGRAGDVGSVKQQANAGRVVSGIVAAERAWPWQAVVSVYEPRVLETLGSRLLGGGSLINNQWVLTAAHLFSRNLKEMVDWQSLVFTTFVTTIYLPLSPLLPDGVFTLITNDAGYQAEQLKKKSFLKNLWHIPTRINLIYQLLWLTFSPYSDRLLNGLHKRPLTRAEPLIPIAKTFQAERVIIHQNYSFSTIDFDVALIKLGQEYIENASFWSPIPNYGWINFTSFIRPICLPCVPGNCVGRYLTEQGRLTGRETEEERCKIETDFLLEEELENKNFLSVITGFGHTTERRNNQRTLTNEYLLQGLIKVQSDARCTDAVTNDIPWGFRTPLRYTDRMLCGISGIAGTNIDACQGDSGGPLTREVLFNPGDIDGCWVQIGIVSWGWGCGLTVERAGGARQLPGFYTKVPSVISWIKSNADDLTQTD